MKNNMMLLASLMMTVPFIGMRAQTMINVDLGSGTTVGSGTAGVVASDGWQQKSGSPTFTNVSLTYENGGATGATATLVNASGNVDSIGAATTDANYNLYNRGVGIQGSSSSANPTTITFSNLDTSGIFSAGYDVYVYLASANNFGGTDRKDTFRVGNGTTDYYIDLDETITSYTGSFVQSTATLSGDAIVANYVKFSNMSGASFTIDSYNTTGSAASAGLLVGMQIVAIPEPSTLAMVAVALGSLLIFRRWKF